MDKNIQLKIIDENRHKSGIYMIYNLINHKCYIGSAASNRINVRFRNHYINGTGARLTNQAVNKYGLENFAFVIIEYYPGFV
jgi:group I intron endonuclease